jgi:hypothetical protein|uniref:Uncharacterized protein n=1 Tax=Mus musculus TaxID=10090 RepID=Q9CXF6_MOUSE|nr:unnamed protein product [Mus musculus]BAE43118.1 unnamed protein product [Mus musculus]
MPASAFLVLECAIKLARTKYFSPQYIPFLSFVKLYGVVSFTKIQITYHKISLWKGKILMVSSIFTKLYSHPSNLRSFFEVNLYPYLSLSLSLDLASSRYNM